MKKEDYPIDVVIAWVDGNDPEWKKERNKYATHNELKKDDVGGDARYLDNGLFKFVFRSIEKYAPWVNKVYLVTWGHLPKWLNTSYSKLVIVNHKDFIPSKYLPTFNSDTIALNLHRIPNLSEHFIYFNDDMYLLGPVEKELFFKKGLPRDMAVNEILSADAPTSFWHTVFHDIILLNQTYKKKIVIKRNKNKWLTLKYGQRHFIKNLLLYPFNMFSGFYEPHLPASYLKSMYEYCWEKHYQIFDDTCNAKFRDGTGVTENYVRYVTMCENKFFPINKDKYGCYATMKSKYTQNIITSNKYKYICINDEGNNNEINALYDSFLRMLPNKSNFEN